MSGYPNGVPLWYRHPCPYPRLMVPAMVGTIASWCHCGAYHCSTIVLGLSGYRWSGAGTLAVWGPYGYQWLPISLPV